MATLKDWRNPQGWTQDRWFTALFFSLIALFALLVRPQSDTWWLLRAGQDIIQQRSIPTTDSYSFSVAGGYWPNHEWLTEVLMYAIFRLGGVFGLVLVFALLLIATWWGIYRLCEGAPRWRSMLLLLGVMSNVASWSIRPQLISLALFVLTLHLLIQRRWWWLPGLFLIWANMHAGVMAGGLIVGAAVLAYGWFYRRAGLKLLVIGVISGALTLLNPLGWRLWSYALSSTTSVTRQYLQEWRSPSLSDPTTYPFLLMLVLVVITAWRFRATWRTPRDWILLLGTMIFAVLAIRSVRHAMFFDVLALPLLSRWIAQSKPQTTINQSQGRLHQRTIISLGVLLAIGAFWLLLKWQPPLSQPIVQAVRSCDQPLFNTYEWGGELTWFVPEQRVLIDNRQDPYSDELFLAVAWAEELGDYQGLFGQYGIKCALVPNATRLNQALQRDGWYLQAQDQQLSVWTRKQ